MDGEPSIRFRPEGSKVFGYGCTARLEAANFHIDFQIEWVYADTRAQIAYGRIDHEIDRTQQYPADGSLFHPLEHFRRID